jgi:hypothetical protein
MEVKKGISLIETMISISIYTFILAVQISILGSMLSIHKEYVESSRKMLYCFDSLNFIDKEIVSSLNKRIIITKGKICIELLDGDFNYIDVYGIKDNLKLRISYYKKNYSGSTTITRDIIMEDISNCEFIQKNDLVYIEIQMNNGEIYNRCIAERKIEKAG